MSQISLKAEALLDEFRGDDELEKALLIATRIRLGSPGPKRQSIDAAEAVVRNRASTPRQVAAALVTIIDFSEGE